MRIRSALVCGIVGLSFVTGTSVYAQAPAGAAAARRPATIGGGTGRRPPTGPGRYSPSFGSSVSGGIGLQGTGAGGAPRRQLRRNQTPVLSPYLNLDPNFASSFEGQYLTKILPQEEFSRTQQQTQRAFNSVQRELGQQQLEIQSGLNTTGHATTFMNLGRYYPGQ